MSAPSAIFRCFVFALIPLVLAAPAAAIRIHAPVHVQASPLAPRDDCDGSFVPRQLDHITMPTALPVGFYDSNGAGLAVGDLNNDGRLDIALANLEGEHSLLWNRGGLEFERASLPATVPARAVATVDVDADGLLDLVFTQRAAAPIYWRNQGGERFARELLRGVSYIGYAMNWLDADQDGDLDLLTGSYDVETEKVLGQTAPSAGVIHYENLGGSFRATRIADRSNTLAIWTGLNQADEYEVIIGNDFAVADKYFVFRDAAWRESPPRAVMPHSTMSYADADLDNDGVREIFAVDMKPYSDDPSILAQWQPVMDMMMAMPHVEGDPQIMENVLYSRDAAGQPANIARALSLDGTGWSWSAQFGDLDNDGFQDLYVVNGMVSRELFSHLPDNELVEENLAYRNLDGAGFQRMPGWGLGDRASGRGMTMADLDADGDLDIVVNNLLSPARLFENRLCGGASIVVELRHSSVANDRGIGARLTLHSDRGLYRRELTVASGYLSGNSSRAHFGFPADASLERLTVVWNDGEISELEAPPANSLLRLTRE